MQDILEQLKHGKIWNFGNTKRRKLRDNNQKRQSVASTSH